MNRLSHANNASDEQNSTAPLPLFSQSFQPHDTTADSISFQSMSMPTQSYDSSFLNDGMFPPSDDLERDTYMPKDWEEIYAQQDSTMFLPLNNNDMFASLDENTEQDLLMSDPSFVRQQQRLREQQQSMTIREGIFKSSPQLQGLDGFNASPSARSNLSAMFDQQSDPGHQDSGLPYQMKQEVQQAVHNELPLSQPLGNRTGPVPIVGSNSSSAGNAMTKATASSVPAEIDHQRRFNELQARFRVNYAKKPTQQQTKQSIQVASSFSGGTNSFGQAVSHSQALLGTSMPTFSQASKPSDLSPHSAESPGDRRRSFSPPASLLSSSLQEPSRYMNTENGVSTKGVSIPQASGRMTSSGASQPALFSTRTMPIQIQRVHRANTAHHYDAEQHQRKLDEQLVKVDFEDITVSELKEMLRQRGKPATGKKAILMQRLQEERELVKSSRGGGGGAKQQRHSQPPPLSPANRTPEGGRPRSYQGSSPMIPHANSPLSPMMGSPSSVTNNNFLPGSPGSTYSLNRSIANMHIGSPPMASQHARRYSPYGAPGSPRLSSSPKLQTYSSSVPTSDLSSSPGSGAGPSLSSSFSARVRPSHFHTWGVQQGRSRPYAPFTSSALATPDRDDDHDPFETFIHDRSSNENIATDAQAPAKMEGMEWMDPTIESSLQPSSSQPHQDNGFEDLMNLIGSQGIDMDMMLNHSFGGKFDTPGGSNSQGGGGGHWT